MEDLDEVKLRGRAGTKRRSVPGKRALAETPRASPFSCSSVRGMHQYTLCTGGARSPFRGWTGDFGAVCESLFDRAARFARSLTVFTAFKINKENNGEKSMRLEEMYGL